MYNNVNLISETYEDIAPRKLQIRPLQPPHSVWWQYVRNAFEYLEVIYIARN